MQVLVAVQTVGPGGAAAAHRAAHRGGARHGRPQYRALPGVRAGRAQSGGGVRAAGAAAADRGGRGGYRTLLPVDGRPGVSQ